MSNQFYMYVCVCVCGAGPSSRRRKEYQSTAKNMLFLPPCFQQSGTPSICLPLASASVPDLGQIMHFWVSRGRGLPLHYGVNSPPLWREYPSTAKNMLSAFVCGCLLLPLPSLLRPVGRCSVHTPSLCTCSHLRSGSNHVFLGFAWPRVATPLWSELASSMEGVPVHCQEHAICI